MYGIIPHIAPFHNTSQHPTPIFLEFFSLKNKRFFHFGAVDEQSATQPVDVRSGRLHQMWWFGDIFDFAIASKSKM
tara:strand:+ start:1325 stop:1552 length:228 start_codon:yes stop_codon:yes gene_type:complete